MATVRNRHCVWDIAYHLVLVTKYRRSCIPESISGFLTAEARRITESWEGTLIESKADKNHMHFLISLPPKHAVSAFVGTLKQLTSKAVRKTYGDYLRHYLWGDSFWSDSYYIASVGNVNEQTVRHYIRSQGGKQ